MKNKFFISLIVSSLYSCSISKKSGNNLNYTMIKIDTLLNEKLSSRALEIEQDKVWYAGNNGNYGFLALNSTSNYKNNVTNGDLKLEFRSIAQNSKSLFILSISNPALLYKIDKGNLEKKLVYQETNEKVFYDSMRFFNDLDGIAIGDPTEDYPSIITTEDGGDTWKKSPNKNLPKFADGEAFFAASNTNLIIKNYSVWMVSGGKKSRVFHSSDKGNTWEVYETPIIQGQTMTGIFTADFYDENIGFIAGGNYEKLDQNSENKAVTYDGGKTWKLIANNTAFGYASCVQYIPNSKGKGIVSVGATGVFYSNDGGEKWSKLSEDKDFLTIRFINNNSAIAAGKNRIVKINFK